MRSFMIFITMSVNFAWGQGIGFEVSRKLTQNVVTVSTTSNGFGFIVASDEHSVYIVTAEHLRNSHDSVTVRFYSQPDQFLVNRIVSLGNDVLLLRVDLPTGIDWNPKCFSDKINSNDRVWFIGKGEKWYVSTDGASGTVNDVTPDAIYVDINSIEPGCSGAPFVSQAGIVGMIVKDDMNRSVVAVPISRIRDLIVSRGFLFDTQFKPERKISPIKNKVIERNFLGFSPKGNYALISGDTNKVLFLPAKQVVRLQDQNREIRSASFNPKTNMFATASFEDGSAKIWYLDTQVLKYKLAGQKVHTVLYLPSQDTLAIIGDRHASLWDCVTGTWLQDFDNFTGSDYAPYSVRFSHDGELLLILDSEFTLKVWNVKSGKILFGKGPVLENLDGVMKGGWMAIRSVISDAIFTEDGTGIVCEILDRSNFRSVIMFNSHTGKLVWKLDFDNLDRKIGQYFPEYFDYCAKTNSVFTADRSSISRWNSSNGKFKPHVIYKNGVQNEIQFISVSIDGSKILAVSADRDSKIFDANSGEMIDELKNVRGVKGNFSPNGKMVSVTGVGGITIYNIASKKIEYSSYRFK